MFFGNLFSYFVKNKQPLPNKTNPLDKPLNINESIDNITKSDVMVSAEANSTLPGLQCNCNGVSNLGALVPPLVGSPLGPPLVGSPLGPPLVGSPLGPPLVGIPTESPLGPPLGPPVEQIQIVTSCIAIAQLYKTIYYKSEEMLEADNEVVFKFNDNLTVSICYAGNNLFNIKITTVDKDVSHTQNDVTYDDLLSCDSKFMSKHLTIEQITHIKHLLYNYMVKSSQPFGQVSLKMTTSVTDTQKWMDLINVE